MGLKQIGKNKYLVTETANQPVKAVVYAKEELLETVEKDLSLAQLKEATWLPRVVSPVIGMPDIHQGFGLPIGGVMATRGLISVGAVGMDINCGVRLLKSSLVYSSQMTKDLWLKLLKEIERLVPTGVGAGRQRPLDLELKEVVNKGVSYLIKEGYATEEDREHTEEYGCLAGASFDALSDRAKKRARDQLGTLGAGNHFIGVLRVDKIFEENLAESFGLKKDQLCVMIHCGSRGLGHQTCLDYTNLFWKRARSYGIEVPRKGLAALPIETAEGKRYFGAMAAAVNFAFCNRQVITAFVRQVFKKFFGPETRLDLVYDVAHNIAKWEKHHGEKLLLHRKGATRALPAGHPQNPKTYLKTGHPAIIPGSMGTPSYVVVGTEKAAETFYSVNHGAGRLMSRTQAKKTISQREFEKKMGKVVYSKPFRVIADEAPQAYKDIDLVVESLAEIEITRKVVRLMPLAVIQGH